MSSFYLIIALVFSIIIALVAVANTDTVTVNYIFGRANLSLIVLILGSAFAGALVMGMFSLFRSIKTAFAFRQARHERDALQKKIVALEEEKLFLQAELNRALSVPEEAGENSRDAGDRDENSRDAGGRNENNRDAGDRNENNRDAGDRDENSWYAGGRGENSRDAGDRSESGCEPDLRPGRDPGSEGDKSGFGEKLVDQAENSANPYEPGSPEGDERPS